MTDNEKAATYIGWNAPTCQHTDADMDRLIVRNSIDGRWNCLHDEGCKIDEGEWIASHWRKHHPHCPDMTRPENYMRARVEWSIITASPDVPFTAYSKESVYRGEGKSAVAALAALYDKEHAND